jgi:hypothetical protein
MMILHHMHVSLMHVAVPKNKNGTLIALTEQWLSYIYKTLHNQHLPKLYIYKRTKQPRGEGLLPLFTKKQVTIRQNSICKMQM